MLKVKRHHEMKIHEKKSLIDVLGLAFGFSLLLAVIITSALLSKYENIWGLNDFFNFLGVALFAIIAVIFNVVICLRYQGYLKNKYNDLLFNYLDNKPYTLKIIAPDFRYATITQEHHILEEVRFSDAKKLHYFYVNNGHSMTRVIGIVVFKSVLDRTLWRLAH